MKLKMASTGRMVARRFNDNDKDGDSFIFEHGLRIADPKLRKVMLEVQNFCIKGAGNIFFGADYELKIW